MKKEKKRVTVDGRVFQIDFWIDESLGIKFPYYSVSEVRKAMRRKFFLWGNFVEYEYLVEICHYWTYGSRVQAAMDSINDYLQREKDEISERIEVSIFCRK